MHLIDCLVLSYRMKNWLNQEIFTVGVHNITYGIIIGLALIWLITWLIIRLSRYLIFRVRRFESGQKHAIFQLLQYLIIIIAILFSFEVIHISWNLIIASSAAILVGVGLGLQNLFNDFMSGIILLLDSTIQVNNIIQLEDNTIGRVEDIRMRTTTLKDRDGRYIIVPNRLFEKRIDSNLPLISTHAHVWRFSLDGFKTAAECSPDKFFVFESTTGPRHHGAVADNDNNVRESVRSKLPTHG